MTIIRATEKDYFPIVEIGKQAVFDAHKESCSAEILGEYIETNYSVEAIKNELIDKNNIYHLVSSAKKTLGFSKMILNAAHSNIAIENVTKLDRIYLLDEAIGKKMGYELLQFNIELAKNNEQAGVWLYTWIGNKRAIDFYIRAGFHIIADHNFLVSQNHFNPNYQLYLEF